MIYNFSTKKENAALAALLVYGCYKSRDKTKFKITPDMWGVIERACKSAAKRSATLNDFIEKFKVKMSCSSIQPRYMMSHINSNEFITRLESGEIIVQKESGKKAFWIDLLEECNEEEILKELYYHTAFVIVLVRERLEHEKEEKKEENNYEDE